MKECYVCKSVLDDSRFQSRQAMCKTCKAAKDKGRKRAGSSLRETTLSAKARKRRWARINSDPVKQKAHRIVRSMIESGVIKPRESCEVCHKIPLSISGRRLIQAHHYLGYENPQAVMWVCPKCHRKLDDAARAEGAGK